MNRRDANWVETGDCLKCAGNVKVAGHFTDPVFRGGLLRDFGEAVVNDIERRCSCDWSDQEREAVEREACNRAEKRARDTVIENRFADRYERR